MPTKVECENFLNPEKKSLEELTFQILDEDKIVKHIPALDKRWAPRAIFTNYTSLVVSGGLIKQGAALDEWKYDAECFREDMEFLLNRKHHEFWSYMVYQKTALAAIVSFLQRATPFYISIQHQIDDTQIIELYEEILCLVLRIICRLVTRKESPECYLSKEHIRDLIYKNYLISVPMLFDLLIAVGDIEEQNKAVLKKIVDTLVKIEENYKSDLLGGLAFFKTAFRSIQTQAENEGCEGAGGGVLEDDLETPYDDVSLYTLDCAYTLSVLLEVCSELRIVCGEIKLGQSIANFYDTTIPYLYKNIFLVNEEAISLKWLNQARLQFLKAFRYISYSYVDSVINNPGVPENQTNAENFIGLLVECLAEPTFVIDYEHLYPVKLDIEILQQACKELDEFKSTFVLNGYMKESLAGSSNTIAAKEQLVESNKKNSIPINVEEIIAQASSTSQINGLKEFPDAAERDIDLEITAVLDVLPHLGTGFIRKVLSRYDNSEEAVAAILEENLPPDLLTADQNEIYIPPCLEDKVYEETGYQHFNIHDGDPYDIMTQDKPACLIKQGKGFPNAPQNAMELLDDKTDIKALKERYQQYSLVAENDEDEQNGEYSDEYDDSYDAILESETKVPRSKELKAGLAEIDDVTEEESDDNHSVGSDKNDQKFTPNSRDKRTDFCENPEDVRARYEARRQSKWQKRPGYSDFKNSDVVGAPKGQGQEKETLRNRQKKEAHKSSRANHNRKSGAAFKRSKGMIT